MGHRIANRTVRVQVVPFVREVIDRMAAEAGVTQADVVRVLVRESHLDGRFKKRIDRKLAVVAQGYRIAAGRRSR